jgi:hypothetical protein
MFAQRHHEVQVVAVEAPMRVVSPLWGMSMTQLNAIELEELGSRTLPGAVTTAGVLAASALTPMAIATPVVASHPLAGQGQGTFVNPVTPGSLTIGALTTYNLAGTANLAGMGQVNVTGTVHSVGFVLAGQATGQITFSNSRGSVTIQLIGPVQPGNTALPTNFSYSVVAHTGAFATLADHGTLGLAVSPALFNYVPQPHGSFAIAL